MTTSSGGSSSDPVSWTRDGQGFFYAGYDEPQEEAQFQSLNLNQKLYYHKVGTPQSEDVLVYYRPDHPEWGYDAQVSEDGRYLIIAVWKGTDHKNRLLYKDLDEPYGMPVELIDHFEHEYTFLGNDGTRFFFKTDLKAKRGRVVSVDVGDAKPKALGRADPRNAGDAEASQYRRQYVCCDVPKGRHHAGQDV